MDMVFQRNSRLARGISETAVELEVVEAVDAHRRWAARRAGRARMRIMAMDAEREVTERREWGWMQKR